MRGLEGLRDDLCSSLRAGKGSWLQLLPQRSGCRMGWCELQCAELPALRSLFVFALYTAPAWTLLPGFSLPSRISEGGEGVLEASRS